jgi:hypothetical protein
MQHFSHGRHAGSDDPHPGAVPRRLRRLQRSKPFYNNDLHEDHLLASGNRIRSESGRHVGLLQRSGLIVRIGQTEGEPTVAVAALPGRTSARSSEWAIWDTGRYSVQTPPGWLRPRPRGQDRVRLPPRRAGNDPDLSLLGANDTHNSHEVKTINTVTIYFYAICLVQWRRSGPGLLPAPCSPAPHASRPRVTSSSPCPSSGQARESDTNRRVNPYVSVSGGPVVGRAATHERPPLSNSSGGIIRGGTMASPGGRCG